MTSVFFTVKTCFGAVEALRPPAAGDRLLELLPVRFGEGTRGEDGTRPVPCPLVHRLQERLLVGVRPTRSPADRWRVFVVQQQHVVLRQVVVGQVLGGCGGDVDLESGRRRRGMSSERLGGLLPVRVHVSPVMIEQLDRPPASWTRLARTVGCGLSRPERCLGSVSGAHRRWRRAGMRARLARQIVERDRAEDRNGHVEAVDQVADRGRSRSRTRGTLPGTAPFSFRTTVSRALPTAASKINGYGRAVFLADREAGDVSLGLQADAARFARTHRPMLGSRRCHLPPIMPRPCPCPC